MATLTADEVIATFKEVKTVAICPHINPDGDALGSSLALAALLRSFGCEATCLLAEDRPAPSIYSFFEDYEFVPAIAYEANPDLFIAIDVPSTRRLCDGVAVMERSLSSLCIDHHPDYGDFADHYHGDSKASATASIVWSLIKASGVEITKAMADYCYVGLMTDTGRFAFQNTNQQAFHDASEMVAHGVDPSFISMRVYENKSTSILNLESRLIDRMHFANQDSVVYSWIDENDFQELQLNREDSEGLPTILRSIADVQVALLLRIEDDTVRVNMRSRGDFDVGALARSLNGGGHKAAAGITYLGSKDEVLAILLGELHGLEPLE